MNCGSALCCKRYSVFQSKNAIACCPQPLSPLAKQELKYLCKEEDDAALQLVNCEVVLTPMRT